MTPENTTGPELTLSPAFSYGSRAGNQHKPLGNQNNLGTEPLRAKISEQTPNSHWDGSTFLSPPLANGFLDAPLTAQPTCHFLNGSAGLETFYASPHFNLFARRLDRRRPERCDVYGRRSLDMPCLKPDGFMGHGLAHAQPQLRPTSRPLRMRSPHPAPFLLPHPLVPPRRAALMGLPVWLKAR
ncbi:MAG: hypothetical protein AAFY53_15000 [Pseudomonadota bacterium]